MKLAELQELLVQDAGVRPIVISRVFPLLLPEGATLPAVLLQPIVNKPFNALDGWAGLDLAHVIVDSLATTYQKATQLRDAARVCLNAAGLTMQEETEDYDEPARTYRISQQWLVFD